MPVKLRICVGWGMGSVEIPRALIELGRPSQLDDLPVIVRMTPAWWQSAEGVRVAV